MTIDFHWFLPTSGDSRFIVGGGHGASPTRAAGSRTATIPYLGQIARAAEQLGFVGALTPSGAWCEDAWLTTAMLSQVSERLKFLVAFRPGSVSPTLAAQMAATFQRHSNGRLLLNVVTGGEDLEQRFGVGGVQSCRRLIEYVHDAEQTRAQLNGQSQSLQFTGG